VVETFPVFGQSSAAAEPSEGAFDDPALGQPKSSPENTGIARRRNGFVTPASACWTLVGALAKGHEEDQLRGISVPA
jgi:hypothetical protein